MPVETDLWDSAAALNEYLETVEKAAPALNWDQAPRASGRNWPGDDYNRRAIWADVLTPHGWVAVHTSGEVTFWRRPGKTGKSWSATTGHCKADGRDLLYVFSSNAAPLAMGKTYSRFGAYTMLNHAGDYKAAARSLAGQNYGEQRPVRPLNGAKTPPHETNGHATETESPAQPKPEPEPEQWDNPVPLDTESDTTEPFPLECLPEPVGDFLRDVASSIGCPVDYPACFALGMMAGVAGSLYAVEVKPGYVEQVSFYICAVAPKGSGKTPALKLIASPIYEESSRRQHDGNEAPAYVSDVTAEKVADLLRENTRGLLVIRDELSGWMKSMDQYKAKGSGADRQFWLSVNSGDPVSVHRKDPERPPIFIRHPCVTVVGGIQPSVLSRMSGDDDGFYDRIMFSYPEPLEARGETWQAITNDRSIDWGGLLLNIMRMPMQLGDYGARPFFLRLSQDAKHAWEDWTNWIASQRNDQDYPEWLKGPAVKMTGFAARLAGLVHVFRVAALTDVVRQIEGDDMRAADLLARYFLSHARKVYRAMGRDPRIRYAQVVLRWIEKCGKTLFSRRDLWRGLRKSFDTPESLSAPLKLLTAHGFVRWIDPAVNGLASHHTSLYAINPKTQVTGDSGDKGDRGDAG